MSTSNTADVDARYPGPFEFTAPDGSVHRGRIKEANSVAAILVIDGGDPAKARTEVVPLKCLRRARQGSLRHG